MITMQRQEEILRILQERKTVTVGYLAESLYVSLPTIRRDLTKLARDLFREVTGAFG